MFTYIRPVHFNVQIRNGRKAHVNVFGLVIIMIKNKNYYTNMANILYAAKHAKLNNSNYTNTLQSIQKCKNGSSQMGENCHRYRNEYQILDKNQRKKSIFIGLHYY